MLCTAEQGITKTRFFLMPGLNSFSRNTVLGFERFAIASTSEILGLRCAIEDVVALLFAHISTF